jgi:hypothetical protein
MALKLADALGTSPELWFGTFGSGAKAEFHGEISAALSPAICCFYDTAQFGGTTAISIRAPHAIDSYSVRIGLTDRIYLKKCIHIPTRGNLAVLVVVL